jgi:RHS repeat-associated protein
MGFVVSDGVRQKFTGYERDSESGLDFAKSRYYSSNQGRFTSVDPLMPSAILVNPQTFNRYSYVTNSPVNLIDPSGLWGIIPVEGCIGGAVTFQSLLSDGQATKPEQQPKAPLRSSQSRIAQTPTGVTVEVVDPRPYWNLPLGPNFYFNGMGALMIFTVVDENGAPMLDLTISEAVTPTDTIQNSRLVTTADGKIIDLVGRGSFGSQLTREEAREEARHAQNTPNNVVQDHVMFIMSSIGRSAIATHSRTFSNVDANGNLNPVISMNNYSNNYKITHTEIKVTPVRPLICPRVFR